MAEGTAKQAPVAGDCSDSPVLLAQPQSSLREPHIHIITKTFTADLYNHALTQKKRVLDIFVLYVYTLCWWLRMYCTSRLLVRIILNVWLARVLIPTREPCLTISSIHLNCSSPEQTHTNTTTTSTQGTHFV